MEGAPGTGKSYAGLCIASKRRLENTLYICTSVAFKNYVEWQGHSTAVLVETSDHLLKHINAGLFETCSFVLIDDAQNLNCSLGVVCQLLSELKRNRSARLFVLFDNRYQCFDQKKGSFRQTLTDACRKLKIDYELRHLRTIHRNTRKVAYVATSIAETIPDHGMLPCSHHLEGDDIEVVKGSHIWEDSAKNDVVQFVSTVSSPKRIMAGMVSAYRLQDIAVLVDTDNTLRDILLYRKLIHQHIPNAVVQSASVFPRTGIIVDSVDSIEGLDSMVCLFVLSSSRIQRKGFLGKLLGTWDSCRTIANPQYRTFLVSRATHKAVFLLPLLDASVFKSMMFDTLGPASVANQVTSLITSFARVAPQAFLEKPFFFTRFTNRESIPMLTSKVVSPTKIQICIFCRCLC